MKSVTFSRKRKPRREAGQAMLFTVLGLGIFLVGAMAFAIDLSNWYFTRQSAQTAADAACTAAAMDMLVGATNGSLPSKANFTPGTAFDCNSNASAAPCQYAAMNSFASSIKQSAATSGTLGDNVYVDFPSAANYVCRDGTKCLSKLKLPSSVASPIVRVTVTDNVPTWFAGMLKGLTSQSTAATSICAVEEATSPIPILVLNPTVVGSLSINGGGSTSKTGDIAIAGGPSKSIQVNSDGTGSGKCSGGTNYPVCLGNNPTINLCAGGNSYCGSSMGTWGSQPAPTGFWNTTTKCTSVNSLCSGTQIAPQFNSPSAPIADPLATVSAPQDMGFNGTVTPAIPGNGTLGCYDSGGCTEYGPGNYPTGINVKGVTAIFDPGIYYVTGGLSADSNSCLLPSTATGDGSGGVMFYFADNNSVSVVANSGSGKNPHGCPSSGYNGALGFNTTAGPAGTPLELGVKCTGGSVIPNNLPTVLSGSVLLAPCRAPTVNLLCGNNCNVNPGSNGGGGFGDPLGTGDPNGEQRGILFFQNRAQTLTSKNQPSWGGGGSMLLAGTMYFHQCLTTGKDTGVGCDNTNAFTYQFSLGGTPSSSTYVLGDIITDQLSLSGNAGLTMDLNPSAAYSTLKAALVQ